MEHFAVFVPIVARSYHLFFTTRSSVGHSLKYVYVSADDLMALDWRDVCFVCVPGTYWLLWPAALPRRTLVIDRGTTTSSYSLHDFSVSTNGKDICLDHHLCCVLAATVLIVMQMFESRILRWKRKENVHANHDDESDPWKAMFSNQLMVSRLPCSK
jgi:hypothetical protein